MNIGMEGERGKFKEIHALYLFSLACLRPFYYINPSGAAHTAH
jgi:hypothetical protein